MLVEKHGILVPRETPDDLIAFIHEHIDKSRFLIAMLIPSPRDDGLIIMEGYFTLRDYHKELTVRTQQHCRDYRISHYAIDHIIAIVPTQKRRRLKYEAGWASADAEATIQTNASRWHKKSFLEWLIGNPNL